ncbi:ATP-dependent sacrificial sulfur transferase LarE [Desulforhopalus sp. 52FAK]
MGITDEKIVRLKEILQQHTRLAVAFSGGIDSTFLLHFAIQSIGGENVIAYSCTSAVNSASGLVNMRKVFATHFAKVATLSEVEIFPLSWKEFVTNNDKRCYFCKKRMYRTLLDESKKNDCFTLADGTNVDDLKGNRPGLRAIRELNIQTPLVDAGLTKQEIRRIAKEHGLINYDLPSNSCLATRVKKDTEITLLTLNVIEKAENYLKKLGFVGCRVKVSGHSAVISLVKGDFALFLEDDVRVGVIHTLYHLGLTEVSLSLTAR